MVKKRSQNEKNGIILLRKYHYLFNFVNKITINKKVNCSEHIHQCPGFQLEHAFDKQYTVGQKILLKKGDKIMHFLISL
jgi:hypothetical protein